MFFASFTYRGCTVIKLPFYPFNKENDEDNMKMNEDDEFIVITYIMKNFVWKY